MYKFTLTLFILDLVIYSFFMYLKNEERGGMMVVMCEERETIKNFKN